MKFMSLLKSAEAAGPPPPALLGAIGKLGMEAGKMLEATNGLLPSSMGARLRLSKGKVTVTDGPFAGEELVGAYAIWNVGSKKDAIAWGTKFLELYQEHWPGWEGTIEIRQLFDNPGG